MSHLAKSAKKVQQALADRGLDFKVVELAESARTVQQAADAIGCKVDQSLKSLIFQGKESKKRILILVSGSNRVDEDFVSEIIGEKIVRAKPDFVREVTGFAIGGIPPIGHKEIIETYMDDDLLHYEELWAAAGTPHAVFSITSSALEDLIEPDNLIRVRKCMSDWKHA